jgi:hypothetical protein
MATCACAPRAAQSTIRASPSAPSASVPARAWMPPRVRAHVSATVVTDQLVGGAVHCSDKTVCLRWRPCRATPSYVSMAASSRLSGWCVCLRVCALAAGPQRCTLTGAWLAASYARGPDGAIAARAKDCGFELVGGGPRRDASRPTRA